uniref:Sodium-coupled monocarboxylate transporter 1 n=1 Tax=Clastoptera arizonana TaxID=38151 RepID=A0A1B6D5M6_9HEMI
MSLINGTTTTLHAHMTFDWVEYTVFAAMLGLSVLIGMYYGFIKTGKETVTSYILGDKNMNIFPVIMSLISSHVSGITLIGVPSETYMFGTQYYAVIFVNIIVTLLIVYIFIPVFYKLQLNSVYEYLEMRFCHRVRVMASLIFAFYLLLYIPVVIYVPALAFNQLTGYSVHVITPIVSVICIFYTTFGGLKGVSWTVAMQSIFTITSVIFIIYIGCCNVGGFSEVFRKNEAGHRLEMFNLNPDPFARNTFWTVTFGATFNWLATLAIQPGVVQRFISVPTQRHAVQVIIWGAIGVTIVKSLTVFMGLLMYATYSDCDPFATGEVEKSSQLLPFYVLDIMGDYRGLTGLFIAGVFSAALSTMSCGLNAAAGTIYEDFVTIFYSSEKHAPIILKLIVVILGTLCVTLVFIVEHLGGVLQVSATLNY